MSASDAEVRAHMRRLVGELAGPYMARIAEMPAGSCFFVTDVTCHIPKDEVPPDEAREMVARALADMATEALRDEPCPAMRELFGHVLSGAKQLEKRRPRPGRLWAAVLSVREETFFIVEVDRPVRVPRGAMLTKGGDA